MVAEQGSRIRDTIERAAVLKDGVVYDVPRPGRHDAAIAACVEALKLDTIGPHEQGFVTSKGAFVNRYQAARIALRAGQITSLDNLPLRTITSEDLWCRCGALKPALKCCGP